MINYKFNFETLFNFSNSNPYSSIPEEYRGLFEVLDLKKTELEFPAINNDVGNFIQFMMPFWSPETVFEMGSGYGHSAFWFLLGDSNSIKEIFLTEKHKTLIPVFNSIDWPKDWLEKIKYKNEDAFSVLETIEKVDLALIDGVKADYLRCLEQLESKTDVGAVVLIDNSYWRGSFLDDEVVSEKDTAKKIKELHLYLRNNKKWASVFIPFIDGVTLLRRL